MKAEDGPIDSKYPLKETPSDNYSERTEWNVRDSDASFILTRGKVYGGTQLAIEMAAKYGRPVFTVDLNDPPEPAVVSAWIQKEGIRSLGIGGPREESEPGIYSQAFSYLRKLLE